MTSAREVWPRRRRSVAVFVPLGLGLLFLAIGLNRPGIANMRTVDLAYLLATGACQGAGLVAPLRFFVFRREG
jgi:hypothetical protein